MRLDYLGALRQWLPIAVVATLLTGLAYVVGQQVLRQSANDPQVQMAEDAAAALSAGQSPQAVAPQTVVDMARSLAPYLIVYGDDGRVLAASAQLNGQAPPPPPAGVFEYVREHGLERVTWQPRSDVRVAAIVIRYSGTTSGFVVAGRSLREVERRTSSLFRLSMVALAVTLFVSAVAVVGMQIVGAKLEGRRTRSNSLTPMP